MVTADRSNAFDDLTRVDVRGEEQLLFWSRQFGVSSAMIRQAVRIVGSKFKDVALFLQSRGLPHDSP